MTRLVPTIAAIVLGLGCTCESRPARPAGRTAPAAPEAPPPPAPDPPPALDPGPPAREVTFTTSDGVTIAATLRPPRGSDEPIVLLVHQLGSDRSEWAPLLERLDRAPRIASLALDLRGHGGSTAGRGGATLSWRDFSREQWASTQQDVRAAIEWLESEASGVAPSQVLAIGSSIGSSAAIAAAAREPRIVGVLALSPGRAYHGFDAITPTVQLAGRPFLAVVAAEELDGVETAQAMARITSGEAVVVPGAAHGVALLSAGDTLDRVEAFVRDVLGRRTGR